MSITGALILLSVTWFMVFFMVLPVRFRSQDEAGHVEPGTPRSAPADPMLKRKAWITTGISLVVWALIMAVILSGRISVYDLDVFGVLNSQKSGS
jgi:predicted secreted protein